MLKNVKRLIRIDNSWGILFESEG